MPRFDLQCKKCKKLTVIYPPEGCEFPVNEMFCAWCQEGEGHMDLLMYADENFDGLYELVCKLKDLESRLDNIERHIELDLESSGQFDVQ
jgi:hypothetical protein